jgi:molecular chaperone IbpA
MRTYDYAPLYRSTIGFDRLFDRLENSVRPDWPPYDIEKKSENEYRIVMAVAGFSADQIQVTQEGSTLHVTGRLAAEKEQRHMLHQGIATRNFSQSFSLASHVKVASAELENGLLVIELLREIPEELKPRRIDIKTGAGKLFPHAVETAPAGAEKERVAA